MSQVAAFNEGQQTAIEARGKNILVSAPAGSGKTKILVSRILSLLKEGVAIDQFLVLTFTQAAAQEMKQRLMGMLDEEIALAQGDLKAHLLAQKAKLPLSYITNFHGFCNALIDHYGYLVGVKTGYEILSDTETLFKQALDITLDRALEDAAFCEFRSLYFHDREQLEERLQKLYEILQALGDREAFIAKMDEEVYGFLIHQNERDLSEWCFYPQLQQELTGVVMETLAGLEELKMFCQKAGIVPFYERPLSQTKTAAGRAVPYEALKHYYTELLKRLQPGVALMGTGGLNEWAIQKPEASYNIPWKDLGEAAEAYKNTLSSKKTALTSRFKKVYEQLLDRDVHNTMLVHQEAKRVVDILLHWTIELENVYRDLKAQVNGLDFNDLERYATQLLQADLPVAKSLNEKLYEIMVDEYQDTNMVQENIVRLIADATSKQVPCFMVGDMKQSIYRFRQADPEIFKEKYDRYPEDEGALRVDLVFNYRSSKVVLDSINFIFNQIMDVHFGSLEYYRDPKAQLNYDFLRKEGAKDTSEYALVKARALSRMQASQDDKTEILMVHSVKDKPKNMEDGEYEAYMIAARITSLVASGLDGKALGYSDCAVLMRQATQFMVYKKVFDRFGIPTTIVLSKGFMQATEIRQMMMLYKALWDPRDDLAMMSVLRAPFDFSYFPDAKIAAVRKAEESLYDNILENEAFSHFIEVFNDLRTNLWQMSFSDWHQYFFEISGYLQRVRGMRNGLQRYQNLLLLVEKIKAQETEIHWIKDWIDYFENLGSGLDAPAVMPKDQQAVVFMTIHKSKGLEFPVVFVAMHDKKFNLQDSKDRFIFDRNLSMSIKPRQRKDLKTELFGQEANFQGVCVEYANPFFALLARLQNKDTISEEMRIYYVALTRAGKKLILTGSMNDEQCLGYLESVLCQNTEKMPEMDGHQGWILNRKVRHADHFLDWLMPAVFRHPDVLKQLQGMDEQIAILAEKILKTMPIDYAKSMDNTSESRFDFRWMSYQEILDLQAPKKEINSEITPSIPFDMANYAYLSSLDQPQSLAVTALEEKPAVLTGQLQREVSNSGLSATEKGTLVHDFMEWLPLDRDVSVQSVIDTLFSQGKYTAEEHSVLLGYTDKLEVFRQSKCFKMMQEACLCLKEQSFCLNKEGTLIHGIMDVLCLFEDKAVVMDYKTDRVSKYTKNEDLIKRHATQLTIYQEALKKIYPDKAIEGYLCYLETGRCVKV